MSRRKQSNPKPLKRKTEDTLEEVAELLHLPTDLFSVRDPEDDVHEYTLYSKQRVREGVHFGPYGGHVTNVHKDSLNVIETKGQNGERTRFAVTEDSGGWLKLLKPAASYDVGNVALFYNESAVWCTITSDIEPDTEVLVNHRWAGNLTPPRPPRTYTPEDFEQRTHSKHLLRTNKLHRLMREIDEDAFREENNHNDSDGERASERGRKTQMFYEQNIREHNGSVSNDSSAVKYEPTSPVSPNSSAASPTTIVLPKNKTAPGESLGADGSLCLPYMNGCNYPPAFPYGGLVADTVTDGHFKCDVCDVSFNSRRILEVHQAYYCQGKTFATTVSSDTDTEENTATNKSDRRIINSPIASEEEDINKNKESTSAKKPPHDPVATEGTSPLSKRRRTTSTSDVLQGSLRMSRLFKCPYCSYSTDKKASLTRHIRMHGTSPSADGHCDLPLSTPPMARYCANCDIQFASYKNYQVHKEFYCNTRHVHKSITSSSSPNPGQQPQQSQHQQPMPLPSQSRSPENPSVSAESTATTKGYNMVLNQPLYAAISTSPLILVPCSYVAGGGLSPAAGLIPAGNIIIPNPSTTPDVGSDSQGPNVIPTYTVMSGAERASVPSPVSSEEVVKDDGKLAKLGKEKVTKQETVRESKQETKEDGGEKPLDLSLRRKDDEDVKVGTTKFSSDASGSRSSNFTSTSSSTSCSSEESAIPSSSGPSLPILPLVNSALDLNLIARSQIPVLDPVASALTPVLAPPQVLVKQGTSKCKECNIVFYKHENYLVHKNRYCASRMQHTKRETASPEKEKSDSPGSPERDETVARVAQKSPISSPRVSNSRTPPAPDATETREPSPNQSHAGTLLQYFCASCGIKYTSVDNLRAHQLYYCPKRDMSATHPIALVPTFSRNAQEFKCGKCKNAYPTEELLRQHPCVVQRKCPYCDVYCPTLSAAQRHLVTHTGIKSFRCSLCGYKGHTLRGMRTHIRIHLDKNNSTPEEAYILCMDEGGTEIGCASRKSSGARVNSDRIKSVIATEPPNVDTTMAVSPVSGLSPAMLPTDVVAIKAVPEDPVATGDTTHWCQICGYSSSYKGNVVRHVKLVHKDLISSQAMSNIVNSRPSVDASHKQSETVESRVPAHDLSTSATDHSNSSSSVDVKPMVNGLLGKGEVQMRLDEKALVLKTEAVSPPPPQPTDGGTSPPKGVKRTLSEDGQCPSGNFPTPKGPKYCKSCDISFNYLSNFLAHKKFYCTPRPGEVAGQESTTVQSVQ